MGHSISKYAHTDPRQFASPKESDSAKWREYDYVVVGGGTAGCVLAARLSEDRNATVLLIEAGKSEDFVTTIPFAFTKTFKSSVDWAFKTTPQSALNDRVIDWPRGKVLGGTSAINASIYHQCAPQDFEEWEKLGNEGWKYDAVRPYLLKSETYHPSPLYPGVDTKEHGTNGPIQTGHHKENAPISKAVFESIQALGVPYTDDVNTPKGTAGVVNFISTIDQSGRRSSTAAAYLTRDVLARPNLTVAVGTHVDQIVFAQDKDAAPRATGVLVSTSATAPQYGVRARREVVLSSGAVGSPQLLLRSGVGPAGELASLGIPVVRDLPATGKNLSDHVGSGSTDFRAKPGVTWDHLMGVLPGVSALLKWLIAGKGPLGGLTIPGGAFIRTDDPNLPFTSKSSDGLPVRDLTSGPGAPDIEIMWAPICVIGDGAVQPPSGTLGITMLAIALRPESVGSVTLKSKDPWDAPIIDANYYASENDLHVVARGVRFLLRLARTEPLASLLDLKPHSTDTNDFFWPGDADPDQITDDEIKAFVRKNALPDFHPACSARMGTDPATSVVDAQLRVHGVQGLRIADASVFPTQVSGHPLAVVVAVAEKAADMIKGAASK